MIAEPEIDKKRRERKLAALVALAAQKEKSLTSCLSNEEMALLVNGNCSRHEKERGWEHLSACDLCYEQWFCLKMEKTGEVKKRGRVHLLRPRNFALIGSVIAVAASVVLFLNIPQTPRPDHAVKKLLPSLQATREVGIVVSQDMKAEMAADQEISLKESPRRLMSTAPQSTENVLGTPDLAMTETEPIQEWLETVREGCLKGQTGSKFWTEIILKGDQLLQDKQGETHMNEKDARDFRVLQLIPRSYKKDVITGRCEQILAELAEDGKSR
jgi:hypothetical protein